ncbi:MAG: glycosyltransferase family 39 protein [candidate division WOR-3 bacterium]|nr:glycosyltransferase family 39 protein [candidate division WOR-3 bacterium]
MRKIPIIIHLVTGAFIILNLLNLKNTTLIDWDEGVFALQARWLATMGSEGKPFNFQTPPLFQILVALLFKLFGYNTWLLSFLSVIFSSLSIYLLFLFARDLYNDTIGVISTIFFATTEFFLFFSRSGLSDATFTFFFLSAIYFFYRSLQGKSRISCTLCSIFTILACYTKYTGPVLFLIYLLINLFWQKKKTFSFYLFTIIIPLLFLIPYYSVFVKFVSLQNIFQRHGKLLGVNHLKFLYYLVRFAPIIFITALFYRIKERSDYFILITIVSFFTVLGFYHPYFRLAYPLIPLISIYSGGFVAHFKKIRILLILLVAAVNLFLARDTITYRSRIPVLLAYDVEKICQDYGINYIITSVPPNFLLNISGNIILSENQIPINIRNIDKFGLNKRTIIKRENNLIKTEKEILFLHSSIFAHVEKELMQLRKYAELKKSYEFIDAPVYYKDPFNELKEAKQIYEILIFRISELDYREVDILWNICFEPGVALIRR